MLADFDLTVADSLDSALAALADGGDGGTQPLAGGTNLLVDIRARHATPPRLVAIGRLAGLKRIDIADGRVRIGALTTVGDVLRDARMGACAPSVVESARVFGGQMVRNAATVVGNLCYGSPAADMTPPLLTLDAELTLTSARGSRVVPLDRFYRGFKKDTRETDEIVTGIAWNAPRENAANLFYKLGRRKGDAITVVGVAVTVAVDRGKCSAARIALGAVAPVVMRARGAEEMLVGEALTPSAIDDAARRAAEECTPIDDVRASADYRRHAVHMLTRRLVGQAWERLS